MPLIAGTGTANTHETIELTKEAARLGYDAAMVVVPYYCHPTQEGIYYHFSQICKNTDLPIMVYNIPLSLLRILILLPLQNSPNLRISWRSRMKRNKSSANLCLLEGNGGKDSCLFRR